LYRLHNFGTKILLQLSTQLTIYTGVFMASPQKFQTKLTRCKKIIVGEIPVLNGAHLQEKDTVSKKYLYKSF